MGPSSIHKGHCSGCPFDWGQPDTEIAYNLGCLPGTGEINALCAAANTAWACHAEPTQVCCGHADRRHLPLQHMIGVHDPEPP